MSDPATAADEVLTDVPDDAPPYSDSYEWQPATAAAHNLEHGSDVIKVTTPATAALSARSPEQPDLATVAGATMTDTKLHTERGA